MRSTITIVGVGERKFGVSKAGKPYDFTEVSFTYEVPGYAGVKAESANFSAAALGDYKPEVGDVVEAVMHQANYRTYIDAIL